MNRVVECGRPNRYVRTGVISNGVGVIASAALITPSAKLRHTPPALLCCGDKMIICNAYIESPGMPSKGRSPKRDGDEAGSSRGSATLVPARRI